MVKNSPAKQETWVRSLGLEEPLEKEMAVNSSILAWGIPWTEKLGGLQSTGSKRVRHDLMPKQHQQIFNSALGGVIRFSWGSKCSIIKMNCNWSPANGYM